MEIKVSPEVMDELNAFTSNPYFIAAKYVLWIGIASLVVLLIVRHKLSLRNALLVIIGAKEAPSKDRLFYILRGLYIIVLFALMLMASV
jgi:hypothetical protein